MTGVPPDRLAEAVMSAGRLSSRSREYLELLAQGFCRKQIYRRLDIERRHLRHELEAISRTLGGRNIRDRIVIGIRTNQLDCSLLEPTLVKAYQSIDPGSWFRRGMDCMVRGYTTTEAAQHLYIAPAYVRRLLAEGYAYLGIPCLPAAVALAARADQPDTYSSADPNQH